MALNTQAQQLGKKVNTSSARSFGQSAVNPAQQAPPPTAESTQSTQSALDGVLEAQKILQKKLINADKMQQQLFTAQMKMDLKNTLLSNPGIQALEKLKGQLGKTTQDRTQESEVGGPSALIDPLLQARSFTASRGRSVQDLSNLTNLLRNTGLGASELVNNINQTQIEQLNAEQQGIQSTIAAGNFGMNVAKLPGELTQQQVDIEGGRLGNVGKGLANIRTQQDISGTQPLSQSQRADLTGKLVSEGYTIDDATQVAQTYGAGGMRTDRHNNPAAFTTDIAKQAGLIEGKDFTAGDPFPNNPNLRTAMLIGDPYEKTIKVIDNIGFTTQGGATRWTYTNSIPGANNQEWKNLSQAQKVQVVQQMYQHEGGNGSLSSPTLIESRRQANLSAQNAAKAADKPATAAQETVAGYAARLEQAGKVFDTLEGYTANMSPTATLTQRALPEFFNFLKSSNFQSLEQAQRNFLNATLRRESGAVISPTEFSEGRKQYFPQPGDSAAVLAQKKANREVVKNSFIKASGNAYTPLNNLTGGAKEGTTSTGLKYKIIQ